ncbi:sulfurtransferase [Blastopirellula marina]|uniref:Sulfurtransferase n=2 Tax=Blastopirellula marina TaxID=124 RepID=A0A2S8GQ14_9BACT|nr:sulfurtransferase [Blastopirellula marina]
MTTLMSGLSAADEGNPNIDYAGFLRQAAKVGKEREKRRVTVDQFLEMIQDEDTILLDARSVAMFKTLHVRGAVNLPFPDFTEATLAKVIPNKKTRVVIYCNNNFKNASQAFATKASIASLNINTFNALRSYGYENVYELKPLVDAKNTKIPFGGTAADKDGRLKD